MHEVGDFKSDNLDSYRYCVVCTLHISVGDCKLCVTGTNFRVRLFRQNFNANFPFFLLQIFLFLYGFEEGGRVKRNFLGFSLHNYVVPSLRRPLVPSRKWLTSPYLYTGYVPGRAVDPHSFFADPDPAVLLNADPDPAARKMRIRIQPKKICNKVLYEVLK